LKDCTLSFKSLPKKLKSKLAMIMGRNGTTLNMSNCDCIGNGHNYDSAVILLNANAMISNCRFTHFGAGAIFSVAKSNNDVLIQDNTITDCASIAVYC